MAGAGGQTTLWRVFALWFGKCSVLALVALVFTAGSPGFAAQMDTVIGTGSLYGVYYRVGSAICRLVNETIEKIDCGAVPTAGSLANIEGIRDGSLDIAVVQSDWQHHAVEGTGPFASGDGAHENLRALFSVHGEPFTLVASRASGIRSLRDLAGRRINIGNPGSGQRATMGVLMAAMGWTTKAFSLATELPASQQALALCDGRIDAMIYVAGHPNKSVTRATELCRSVIVEIAGSEIDALVAQNPLYSYMEIPGGIYAGNPEPVMTFGVRATVVTAARLDADKAYAIVKTVFENLDRFRAVSPAFSGLEAGEMAREGSSAPFHEGAARYFREVGLR